MVNYLVEQERNVLNLNKNNNDDKEADNNLLQTAKRIYPLDF